MRSKCQVKVCKNVMIGVMFVASKNIPSGSYKIPTERMKPGVRPYIIIAAYVFLGTYIVFSSAALSIDRNLNQQQLLLNRQRLESHNERIRTMQAKNVVVNPILTSSDMLQRVEAMPPRLIKNRRLRLRRRKKRRDGGSVNGSIGGFMSEVSRNISSASQLRERRKSINEPEGASLPPQSGVKNSFGTLVSTAKGDKNGGLKFNSVLVDLPEYEDTFEVSMEMPLLTPPIARNHAVSPVTKAPKIELLDFLYDDDSSETTTPKAPANHLIDFLYEENEIESELGSEEKNIKLVQDRPEVKSKLAIYRGLTLNLEKGKRVFAFYGIPYGKGFRFKPPLPIELPSREMPFEATHLNAPCFPSRIGRSSTSAASAANGKKHKNKNQRSTQYSKTVASEDCLYLNVWLPDKIVLEEHPGNSPSYPVLVWIHGEGFLSGMETEDYNSAAEFVSRTNIILITIQYRSGVFGFLHMDSTESSGNQGLKDQALALKWVAENIESFGGDSHAVTIMGHDIGAAFVGFHLASNISSDYFTRAVMIGGSPLQPHMFHTKDHANQMAMDLATQLGCVNSKSAETILECLLDLNPLAIWDVQILMLEQSPNVLAFPFVPTEEEGIFDAPLQVLENGEEKSCHVLLGGTSNEGSLALLESVKEMEPNGPTFVTYDKFVTIMSRMLDGFTDLQMDAVLHQYKNWQNLTDGYANQIRAADAVADYYFTSPLRKFSDLWSARGLATYHFLFSQESSAKNRPKWMGAVHGDELDFFFGVPLEYPEMFTSHEQNLSDHMVKILESFINTGVPHEDWKLYSKEAPHVAEFSEGENYYGSTSEPKYDSRLEFYAFWNELFPKFAAAVNSKNDNLISSGSSNCYNFSTHVPLKEEEGVTSNGTNDSQAFKVDKNCYIALYNCSGSHFAIYVD